MLGSPSPARSPRTSSLWFHFRCCCCRHRRLRRRLPARGRRMTRRSACTDDFRQRRPLNDEAGPSARFVTNFLQAAPGALLLRGAARAETARARDVEDDLRTGGDLVQRQLLALVLREEVLGVVDLDDRARDALVRAGLIPGDERVDRRDLDAADDGDL